MGILIVNTVYQVNASESNQVVPKNDNSELMMLKQKRFDDFSITTNALNINDKQVNQEIDQKMEDNKIEDDLSHYMDNDFNEIHNGGNNSINEHNDVNKRLKFYQDKELKDLLLECWRKFVEKFGVKKDLTKYGKAEVKKRKKRMC